MYVDYMVKVILVQGSRDGRLVALRVDWAQRVSRVEGSINGINSAVKSLWNEKRLNKIIYAFPFF